MHWKKFLLLCDNEREVQKTPNVFNILENLFLEHVNGIVSGHESELPICTIIIQGLRIERKN